MDTKNILKSALSIAAIVAVLFSCNLSQQSAHETDNTLSEKSKDIGLSDEKIATEAIRKENEVEMAGAGSIEEAETIDKEEAYPIEELKLEEVGDLDKKTPALEPFKTVTIERSTCAGESIMLATPAVGATYSFSPATPMYTTATPVGAATTIYSTDDASEGTYKLDAHSRPPVEGTATPVDDYSIEVEIAEPIAEIPFGPMPVNTALAGKLTAGEINDFKKWKMWEDYSELELGAYRGVWQMNPTERYSVLVQTESGAPLVDCIAELIAKSGETLWQTRTDNTGKAELWGAFSGAKSLLAVDKIVVHYNGRTYKIERPKTFEKSINSIKIPASCHIPDEVDICFTVDATGSMGDEIAYLQAELLDVIGKIKKGHTDIQLNLGSVFYRDHGDTYLTRNSAFSKDVDITNKFIAEQYADGGGDGPEAVDEALRSSLFEMEWSKEARARILFMILDAPPHQEKANLIMLENCVREAAKKGVRIIPLVASGGGYDMDKSMEYLMRCCALGTNGTYAFLTNHSGVGGQHTAPSTDHYDVETLNTLLLRIVNEYLTVPDCNLQTFIDQEDPKDTVNVVSMIEPIALDSLQNTVDTSSVEIDPDPKEIVVISCYPNPASDYIWVKTSDDVHELFLTDNSGKIMQRLTPVSRLFEMDLSYYPSGIYYIKALIRDEWITARIIVARMK
ncbi:MAG: T9SS type A sorting domain-containing protein [Flavobacteriales bacterium]